jgi:MFS family permease
MADHVTNEQGDPQPAYRLRGNLAPFGYRNYALYWVGLATTRSGRAIEDLGAVWLVYQLTGSPALLGILGLARAVPAIVLGPIAGVVSDRVDQRRLLFVTQGLGLVASLVLGLLIALGRVEFWYVYVQVAIQAAIDVFDGAARQALFPRLVQRRHLSEAVTMSSTAARMSTLIGPAVGGVAIANLGEASPFLLNAATFLGLMAALAAMRRIAPIERTGVASFRLDLSEGFRHIRSAPLLSGLLKLEFVFGILQVNSVIITIVGREVLGVGPEGLGALLSAPALGALIGLAIVLAFGQAKRQGRLVITCMLAYAAALLVFAVSGNFLLSFGAIAAMGLLDSLSTVTRHSVMQLASPSHLRGRVMGNMGTVTRGTTPLAQLESGVVSGALGGPLALVAAAGVLAVAATYMGRTNQALWEFSRDEHPTEPAEGS